MRKFRGIRSLKGAPFTYPIRARRRRFETGNKVNEASLAIKDQRVVPVRLEWGIAVHDASGRGQGEGLIRRPLLHSHHALDLRI